MASVNGRPFLAELPLLTINWVDRLTNVIAIQMSAKIAMAIIGMAVSGIIIYLMLYAFATMRGAVQAPIPDLAMKLVKMAMIISVACSPALFSRYVIAGSDQLQLFFLSGYTNIPATSLPAALEKIFFYFEQHNQIFYSKTTFSALGFGIPDLSMMAAWVIMCICQAVLIVCALIPIIIAKIFLALLLAVGPFFLMLSAWPATQRYAESWLSFLFTAIFTIVIVGFTLSFMPNVFQTMDAKVIPQDAAELIKNPMDTAVTLLCVTVILCYISWNASTFAGALVGGGGFSNPANTIIQAGLNKLAFSNKNNNDGKDNKVKKS